MRPEILAGDAERLGLFGFGASAHIVAQVARHQGRRVFAFTRPGDTDGQVFESLDGGDSWTIIADVPPVSKADFYKGLARDRVRLANVDDIVANPTATKRWQDATSTLGRS